MLPRSLARSARLTTSQIACRVCTCRCGQTIPQHDFKTIRARSYASQQQQRSSPARARTVEKQITQEGLSSDNAVKLYRVFTRQKLDASLQCQPDQLLRFVERFADLAATKSAQTRPGVDVSMLQEIMNENDILMKDTRWCAHWMVSRTEPELRKLGRKMMYTLSHAGDGQATLIIMEGTLAGRESRTSLLKSSELALVRRRLTEMAEGKRPDAMERPDQIFMAKVCEGKVAYVLNNSDRAFKMWQSAMDGAVAYATGRGDKVRDPVALRSNSSPWIDFFNASFAQGDIKPARWAAEMGCQVDDPVSHYHAALLERVGKEHKDSVATGTWLYHMTKAAASGHVRAIHALGVYYSTVAWKYFEDEPRDDIKPTPFDSYPGSAQTSQSTSQRIKAVFGLQPMTAIDPETSLFFTAVFPQSPYERWKMAISWLDTAMNMMYVPSFLVAAKLYLQESFSGRESPPKEALELSDQRYDYASKADYESGKRIQPRTTNTPGTPTSNPGFDPDTAKVLIREVFYASQAQAYRRNRLSQLIKSGSPNSSAFQIPRDFNKIFEEEMLESNVSPNIRKWLHFPEIIQLYVEERKGVLYDDFTKLDVLLEARRICDEMRWDLFDEEGGLIYKHR